MARGTFSHSKLKNVMKGLTKIGPFTIHHPSGVSTTVFDASVKYKDDQVPLVVIAGSNFGRGSARDWATKGPYLLGKYFLWPRACSWRPLGGVRCGALRDRISARDPPEIEPQNIIHRRYLTTSWHRKTNLDFFFLTKYFEGVNKCLFYNIKPKFVLNRWKQTESLVEKKSGFVDSGFVVRCHELVNW